MTDRYLLEDGSGSLFLEDGVSYYLNEAATGALSGDVTIPLSAATTSTGQVGTVGAVAVALTFAVTAAAVVGTSSGSNVPLTDTVTSAAQIGVSSGTSVPLADTITSAAQVGKASGATVPLVDTITSAAQIGVSSGASVPLVFGVTSAASVAGSGLAGAATIPLAYATTPAAQVGVSSGSSLSETATIASAAQVGKSPAASIPLTYAVTTSATVGRSSAASVGLAFGVAATATVTAAGNLSPAPTERTIPAAVIVHKAATTATTHTITATATPHTATATAAMHGVAGVSSAVTYAPEKLGAGGWVTGLTISPDGNTRIVRCDTLGGWRWDATADQWVATTTATSLPAPFNALDGAEGVFAIAAANSRAYMATVGAIFTSTDHGATWATSLASGPPTSANVSGVKRYSNHMAIDPNDSLTCLYGTVNQGVYYTRNGGTSWTQVPSASVPVGVDGAGTPGASTFGVLCVLIDGAGNWYASPYGSGLYQSTNHGTSWSKISSDTDFVAALGIDLAPNGDIMVCGTTSATTGGIAAANIKVMRYRSGAWTNITPTGTARAWKAPAFDPTSPGRVIVQADGGYTQLSADYGTTWVNQVRSFASPAPDVQWLAASNNGDGTQSFFTTIGGLQWDPVASGRVWMSQGIGVWYATPAANAIQWQAQSRGIEQVVVNDVTVPPGGRPVVSSWDRPIFVVGETTGGGTYPYQYHPDNGTLSSGWHADYSVDNPSWVAASVWDRSGFAAEHPGYSTDGGLTWTNFATIPTSSGNYFAGSIHVGQPGHIIWVSAGGKGASYTTDSGTTWTAVAIPGVTMSAMNTQTYFYYRRPIASEKTTGTADTFYAFVTSKGLYKSTDVGATWAQQADNTQFAGTDWSQMTYLKTVPGKPGHLFITPGWQGAGGGAEALGLPFKRSTDGGVTWSTVSTISSVRGYDFGKAAPGASYPAVYAIGHVGSVLGAYRSDDNCATWTLLSTQPNGTVDFIRNIGASQDTYGKHWITTAGSGLIVGTAATAPTADPALRLSVTAVNHTVEA